MIVLLNEGANGGRHGDTAVLHLDSAVTSKVLVGTSVWTILDESQRTVRSSICEGEYNEQQSNAYEILEYMLSSQATATTRTRRNLQGPELQPPSQ